MKWLDKDGMDILFEDNHLLVAFKPAMIATEPDFEENIKAWIKERDQKPRGVFLRAIHRLDRPVQGVVVFAKSQKGLVRLHQQMRERKIKKEYLGWVEGMLSKKEGRLVDFLLKGDYKTVVATPSHLGAKEAILDYKVLSSNKEKTLVHITLNTGRYHQIRAQFSSRGHPIVGDRKYQSQIWKGGAIALISSKMAFFHPTKGDWLEFDLPNPLSLLGP